MIFLKTDSQIKIMLEGGKKLARVLELVKERVKVGITTKELDRIAELLIKKEGGKPSFKMVSGYKFATCMCVNNCVVHGLPDKYKLKDGDILGIDIGMFYRGFHTDMAWTIRVSDSKFSILNSKIEEFLRTGELALKRAIEKAVIGNRIGHISQAIQETIEEAGYSVVRQLVGHGIGRELHEEPQVPGFLKGGIEGTPELKEGMTLAIEIIYNLGKPEVCYKNSDGWTIITSDGSLSGLFEKTIAITKNGPLTLTG